MRILPLVMAVLAGCDSDKSEEQLSPERKRFDGLRDLIAEQNSKMNCHHQDRHLFCVAVNSESNVRTMRLQEFGPDELGVEEHIDVRFTMSLPLNGAAVMTVCTYSLTDHTDCVGSHFGIVEDVTCDVDPKGSDELTSPAVVYQYLTEQLQGGQ